MAHSTRRKRIWKPDHISLILFSLTDVSEDAMRKLFLWVLLAWAASATGATRLPFIQDDFAKARADAMQRKLPIFVECWAPW
jgi:hypothetical protein